MTINAFPRFILHDNLIQTITHILPDIAIPILIQTHRATRVLQEQVQETHFDVFERGRELRGDVRGDEVRAARVGGQGEGVLGVGCARHECGGRWGRRGGAGFGDGFRAGVEEDDEWRDAQRRVAAPINVCGSFWGISFDIDLATKGAKRWNVTRDSCLRTNDFHSAVEFEVPMTSI